MANQLISEPVDIYTRPLPDAAHPCVAGTQLTIGDLHGNTMKLLFVLIKHGIATAISQKEYARLVAIYQTALSELTAADLAEFNHILQKMHFSAGGLLRLIGDEVADRGSNDYFTLKIFEQLHQHGVPVEILVSNHGIEFIESYETRKDFSSLRLNSHYAASLEHLNALVESGLVTREEVLTCINTSYKPALRIISYSFCAEENEITLYSHAGIGLNTIQSLAKKLHIDYQDTTAVALARTIDVINEKFTQCVQNNLVHRLYTTEEMHLLSTIELSMAPFVFILWNRRYDRLFRPAVHCGYKINFVHGHDPDDVTKGTIYNLDNVLGKAVNANKGIYTVLKSKCYTNCE